MKKWNWRFLLSIWPRYRQPSVRWSEVLQAVLVSVRFYKDLAPSLARVHGSAYPATLAHMMSQRLEQLSQSGLSEDRKGQEA